MEGVDARDAERALSPRMPLPVPRMALPMPSPAAAGGRDRASRAEAVLRRVLSGAELHHWLLRQRWAKMVASLEELGVEEFAVVQLLPAFRRQKRTLQLNAMGVTKLKGKVATRHIAFRTLLSVSHTKGNELSLSFLLPQRQRKHGSFSLPRRGRSGGVSHDGGGGGGSGGSGGRRSISIERKGIAAVRKDSGDLRRASLHTLRRGGSSGAVGGATAAGRALSPVFDADRLSAPSAVVTSASSSPRKTLRFRSAVAAAIVLQIASRLKLARGALRLERLMDVRCVTQAERKLAAALAAEGLTADDIPEAAHSASHSSGAPSAPAAAIVRHHDGVAGMSVRLRGMVAHSGRTNLLQLHMLGVLQSDGVERAKLHRFVSRFKEWEEDDELPEVVSAFCEELAARVCTERADELAAVLSQLSSDVLSDADFDLQSELHAALATELARLMDGRLEAALLRLTEADDADYCSQREAQLAAGALTAAALGVSEGVASTVDIAGAALPLDELDAMADAKERLSTLQLAARYLADSHALRSPGSVLGADDLVPLYMCVLFQSRCRRPYFHLASIRALVPPMLLAGRAGYNLAGIEMACSLLRSMAAGDGDGDGDAVEEAWVDEEEADGGDSWVVVKDECAHE
eukprot:PLAT4386.1.p1 GENE.PLAT4386.1~~PLAT4386.1.p1  ORF type:complete len:700 (+),score=333.33 PLAT4386.1:199-2100(+)